MSPPAEAQRTPPEPPTNVWGFFVRAPIPATRWIIALLLLRCVVVPVVQLIRREAVEPIDLAALAAIAAVLVVSRSYDKTQGTA